MHTLSNNSNLSVIKKTIILIFLITSTLLANTTIILFDCSGSFIGAGTPKALKLGAIQKINELVLSAKNEDTVIFIPIRENSTVSSLSQIVFTKESEKRIFSKTAENANITRMKAFAKEILNEINKRPADRTDIVSAINFAGSIAHLSGTASIYVLSDGDDNVNKGMFNNLKGVNVFHLFVYTPSSNKISELVAKWKTLYSRLGAKSIIVLDAQSSLNYKIRN